MQRLVLKSKTGNDYKLTTEDIMKTFYMIGKPSVLSSESKIVNVHTYLDQIDVDFALKLAHNEQTSKKKNTKGSATIVPHHTVIELVQVDNHEE